MARWSLLLALANLAADVPGALATLRMLQAGCTPGQLSFPTGELQHIDLMVNGLKRRFVLYAPPSYSQAAVPIPLQVLAPGAFNVPELQAKMSEMVQYAQSQKFAFAALAGSRNLMNVVRNSQPQHGRPDDVAYTKAVVKEVFERVCVDDKRVYCAGYSRGARFCMRLASEMSDVFAGIAAISGVRFPRPNNATRPMPIIAFHGTKDPVNPYNGHGSPEYWYDSVPSAISQWVSFNGCTQVEIRQLSEHSSAQRHYGCKDNADVELVTIQGGGHIWPGSNFHWAKSLGFVTHEIKASELIGQFFAAHTLPCENPCKPPALSQVTAPPTVPPTAPPAPPTASTSKDLIFFTVEPVQVTTRTPTETTTTVASLAPTVTKTTTSTSHATTQKPKTTQEPLAGWFGEPKTVPPGWEGETASTAPAGWESEKTPSTAPPGWESEAANVITSTATTSIPSKTTSVTATATVTSTAATVTSATATLTSTTATVTSTATTQTTTITKLPTTTVTVTTTLSSTTTTITNTATRTGTSTTHTLPTTTGTSTTHTLPTTTVTSTSATRTKTTTTITVTTTVTTTTETKTTTTVVYMPTITVTALPTETTTTATTRTATSTTHTLPTTTRTATSTTRTVTTITITVTTTTVTITATRTSTTKTTTKATTMFLATETYTSTWTTTPAPTTTITTTRTTVTETHTTPPEAPALPKTTTEAARLRATTTGPFVVQTPTIAPLDGTMKRKDPNQASSAPTLPPSPHYSPPHPPQMMGM